MHCVRIACERPFRSLRFGEMPLWSRLETDGSCWRTRTLRTCTPAGAWDVECIKFWTSRVSSGNSLLPARTDRTIGKGGRKPHHGKEAGWVAIARTDERRVSRKRPYAYSCEERKCWCRYNGARKYEPRENGPKQQAWPLSEFLITPAEADYRKPQRCSSRCLGHSVKTISRGQQPLASSSSEETFETPGHPTWRYTIGATNRCWSCQPNACTQRCRTR